MTQALCGDVGRRVVALIWTVSGRQMKIAGQSSLVGDLELESIQLVALICAVEREFDLIIESEDFRWVRTVDDLIQAIEKTLE